MMQTASYRAVFESGELAVRAGIARDLLQPCRVCPRSCGVDRISGDTGFCGSGATSFVASAGPHFGEETPITGINGSGTIFFSGCNLHCIYCQNHDISRRRDANGQSAGRLADIMLGLERRGCHNINLVSPSHVVPQVLEALVVAAERGLSIPLVYNSGGYDSVTTLRLLDGVVDIYMPDAKYGSDTVGESLSRVKDYWTVASAAIREMHRQVGDLTCPGGIAQRGLLVRHLVLPAGVAESRQVFEFLASELSKETYVNIMAQYRWPQGLHLPDALTDTMSRSLCRGITSSEYQEAIAGAKAAGLHRGFDDPWES